MREGGVRLQAVLARTELLVRVGWIGGSNLCPMLIVGDLG